MTQLPETPPVQQSVPEHIPLDIAAQVTPPIEVFEGPDSTHGGLVGQALLAGVSPQAVKDMCRRDDAPRLLQRAIATMDRYCDPVRMYSQGVNYHLDDRTAGTVKDFVDYARGPDRRAGRGQRYKARALVRRNLKNKDEFDGFMVQTGKRAHGIREQQQKRVTLEQRQLARDLAAEQKSRPVVYVPPPDPPHATRPLQASNLGMTLYRRLSPELQKQWWSEYVLRHAGIIQGLNTDYLSQTILDTRRFPDLAEPQTGRSVARLAILSGNVIAVGDQTAQLASREQLLVFNALLLFKGQAVTVGSMSRTGVSTAGIKATMSHFREHFNRGRKACEHIFQKDVVWLDRAYRLNGDLALMDVRPPQDPQKSVFAAFVSSES